MPTTERRERSTKLAYPKVTITIQTDDSNTSVIRLSEASIYRRGKQLTLTGTVGIHPTKKLTIHHTPEAE